MLNINSIFSYFFFGEIGNDNMFNIAMLYRETTIMLLIIMYVVIALIIFIIENFNHEVNKFPIHFDKKTESTLDILFVVFPTAIIIYLVIPAVGYIYNTAYNFNNLETLFSVFVIGHQWYWTYEYDLNICNDSNLELLGSDFIKNKLSFDSLIDMNTTEARLLSVDKRLVLPVNSYIKLCITSEDVIHSWAVPQLGIKVDAIPGRSTDYVFYANFNGIYYGQCSELCGVNHGFMPICVEVVPYYDFLDFMLVSLNFNPSGLLSNILIENKEILSNDLISLINDGNENNNTNEIETDDFVLENFNSESLDSKTE